MGRPVIFVTRKLPEPAPSLLSKVGRVNVFPREEDIDRDSLLAGVQDADALVSLVTDTIDRDIIDAGRRLRIISNCAVGFNNIDVAYATQRGILVTNTPGVLTETTAELTFALILALSRHIVTADSFVREGRFTGWDPQLFLGDDLCGKTLGILGMGRIGKAVSRIAAGFSLSIIYHDREERELPSGVKAQLVTLSNLASLSDIITVHVPLHDSTYHVCDKTFFDHCKPSALFVNTSRGPVVDEQALVDALREGKISGAGLDVYEYEPRIHPELKTFNRVVLLPHIGSGTYRTRSRMAELAALNVVDLFSDRRPRHLVNPDVDTLTRRNP